MNNFSIENEIMVRKLCKEWDINYEGDDDFKIFRVKIDDAIHSVISGRANNVELHFLKDVSTLVMSFHYFKLYKNKDETNIISKFYTLIYNLELDYYEDQGVDLEKDTVEEFLVILDKILPR